MRFAEVFVGPVLLLLVFMSFGAAVEGPVLLLIASDGNSGCWSWDLLNCRVAPLEALTGEWHTRQLVIPVAMAQSSLFLGAVGSASMICYELWLISSLKGSTVSCDVCQVFACSLCARLFQSFAFLACV